MISWVSNRHRGYNSIKEKEQQVVNDSKYWMTMGKKTWIIRRVDSKKAHGCVLQRNVLFSFTPSRKPVEHKRFLGACS